MLQPFPAVEAKRKYDSPHCPVTVSYTHLCKKSLTFSHRHAFLLQRTPDDHRNCITFQGSINLILKSPCFSCIPVSYTHLLMKALLPVPLLAFHSVHAASLPHGNIPFSAPDSYCSPGSGFPLQHIFQRDPPVRKRIYNLLQKDIPLSLIHIFHPYQFYGPASGAVCTVQKKSRPI